MIPIRALFECHVKVTNLDRAMMFYGDVLGLKFAHRSTEPRAAFYWIGGRGASMLGVWEVSKMPPRQHLAFRVDPVDLPQAIQRLRAANITPLDFAGNPTDQPEVLAWMPAAAIYFHDPDENLLEFLCMLPDAPQAQLGVLPWTRWLGRHHHAATTMATQT